MHEMRGRAVLLILSRSSWKTFLVMWELRAEGKSEVANQWTGAADRGDSLGKGP